MAGKPKPMSQIKQLLILHRQGQGIKAIARSLSMSRNTVKSYLFKLEKLLSNLVTELSIEHILGMEEPEIYHLFHPGNPSYKDSRYEHFKSRWITSLASFAVPESESSSCTALVTPSSKSPNWFSPAWLSRFSLLDPKRCLRNLSN